jgi:hypothetical protein
LTHLDGFRCFHFIPRGCPAAIAGSIRVIIGALAVGALNGIFLSDFEQGEIGPDRLLGLEGMVSKHRDRPYRAGRSPHWVEVRNWQHPAFGRMLDQF